MEATLRSMENFQTNKQMETKAQNGLLKLWVLGGGYSSGVERVPSMHKVLGSTPGTSIKK